MTRNFNFTAPHSKKPGVKSVKSYLNSLIYFLSQNISPKIYHELFRNRAPFRKYHVLIQENFCQIEGGCFLHTYNYYSSFIANNNTNKKLLTSSDRFALFHATKSSCTAIEDEFPLSSHGKISRAVPDLV